MPDKIDFITYIHTDAEVLENAKHALTKTAEISLTEPGCLRFELYRSKMTTPQYFLINQSWDNRTDFEKHHHSAHILQLRTDLGAINAIIETQPLVLLQAGNRKEKHMNNTIDFVTYIRIEQELFETTKDFVLKAAEHAYNEPGCLRFEVYRTQNQPYYFVIKESWDNQADLDRHRSSDYVKQLQAHLHEVEAFMDTQPLVRL